MGFPVSWLDILYSHCIVTDEILGHIFMHHFHANNLVHQIIKIGFMAVKVCQYTSSESFRELYCIIE